MLGTASASAQDHRHRFHLPHPHLPHGLVSFPGRVLPWIEPWFAAYACLGVVQGGLLPLLLPLSSETSMEAGTIVGAMNLAGLTAPLWGHLADRKRLHHRVLLAGMLCTLAALIIMPMQLGFAIKVALAAVLGIGFAAANTVANMFIVETRPQEEWDARIGALQALSGIGQVGGLLLAGLIGGRFALAFGIAAALVAAAVPIAWLTLRAVHVPVSRAAAAAHPPLGGEEWAGALGRVFHIPTWRGLRALLPHFAPAFIRLQIFWFAAFVMIGAVMSMFPLALVRGFGVGDGLPATVYAFAAAASLMLYPREVRVARQHGAAALMRRAFVVRSAAIALLAAAFLTGTGPVLPLVGFIVLVVSWPALGVSGMVLSAELAPGEKGEALGFFNALSSLASAVGAFLGGCAMELGGYGVVCVVGVVVVAMAAVWATAWSHRKPQVADADRHQAVRLEPAPAPHEPTSA
jgi:MFS family permease